jgi:hypothetical protein
MTDYILKRRLQQNLFPLVFILIAALLVGGAFLFLLFSERSEEKAACRDCNVILISIDALRADHLGIYGYLRETSPNIDMHPRNSLKNLSILITKESSPERYRSRPA